MGYGGTYFGQSGFIIPPAATVTGANDGTSLKGTNVVLGNDFGDPLVPALLTEDREIPYSPGVGLFFTDPGTGNFSSVSPTTHSGTIASAAQQWQATPGTVTLTDTVSDTPKVSLQATNYLVRLINNDGLMKIQSSPANKQLAIDLVNERMIFGTVGTPDNGASLQIPVDVTTGDPGSGVGAWQLGTVIAAAVTLDVTHYVEITIGGTTVKLAIVN